MRLCEVAGMLVITSILLAGSRAGFRGYREISDRLYEQNRKYSEQSFIYESFRNCCNGKGFENLTEWQKTCRSIFKLDYIAWCNCENFMDVSYEKCSKGLFYGCWIGKNLDGEVYCRKWK